MGIFDPTYGAALDPTTMALLSAAASGLQESGPSFMPKSFGQVLGSATKGGIQGLQQTQLMNMEQQKTSLLQSQVEQAAQQQAIQQWALGGMQGPPPSPGMRQQGAPQQGPAQAPGGMLQVGAPQPQAAGPGMQPSMQPAGAMQPSMPNAGASGGPMQGIPDYLQKAAMLKTAGLPAMGEAIQKANEPIVGREGGLYQRTPNGLQLDPGWLQGEQQRQRQTQSIQNENTITEIDLADGRKQKMTKAQELNLVNGTASLKNAMPWASPELTASFQRQMLASPGEDIPVNISVGGREPVKLVLPALNKGAPGLPGITTGQSTESRSAQEKSGTNAGDVQQQIDTEAAGALQSRKILGEMRTLSQDFTQGKVAPYKRALGEWAQALNLPGDWKEEIKGAESQQALQKLTAQMATAAMKQFTNRGTQMEFKTFLQNNPNAELTPGGFQKVLEFMDSTANASLQKQQSYMEWRKDHPIERSQDFLAEWNKKQNEGLSPGAEKPGQFPAAPQQAVARLRMNPKEAAKFDEIFGPGAAARALGR